VTLLEATSRDLPGESEDSRRKSVLQPRFEPGTSRIQVRSAAALLDVWVYQISQTYP
jgi:hypothetical protein